tara:strand:+ start:345 stop:521 length:177 start_codon:yes stop_codon:yes gene_type:complete
MKPPRCVSHAIAPPFNPINSGGNAPRKKFRKNHIAIKPNVEFLDRNGVGFDEYEGAKL